MKFYNNSIEDSIAYLDSSWSGLSSEQVVFLQSKYGFNELPKERKKSLLGIFLSEFINPIEMILIFTVILSFVIGEVVDALALIFIILIDVLIGTYEEYKALLCAESLLSMIKVKAHVIREGKELMVDARELVIGDILILESGAKIAADGRVIECHNFQVNESPLTGESSNIVKSTKKLPGNISLAERSNMVYAGTSVITGRALVVVTATGSATEIGTIADTVTNTTEAKSPLTLRVLKFSRQISIVIIIIAFITAFVLFRRGYDVNSILLSVIALSVSAMPEGLSLALTMALTIASKKMAQKNVIVKKLNSVEALGSCTVIASDKTGTLTVNEQTAKAIILASGEHFTITGSGYNGLGEVKGVTLENKEQVTKLALMGKINNEAHLEKKDGKWYSFGDSIDIAFLSLAYKLNIKEEIKIIEEIPYESENQYSAVFFKVDDQIHCTVKGSLEKIMAFSKKDFKYLQQNEELTSQGYRVIAVAEGIVDGYSEKNIKDLEFLGQVAFIDPIRAEVKSSIKDCYEAGIKVIMITGDHPDTAFAIAHELGLCKKKEEVATGDDVARLRNMGGKEFDKFVGCIKVFSRVTPMDKLSIVDSLKRQGEFVAVTGDGVNDAPAIKAANIGIAMGYGTDVAKETATMIIADNNFSSIVTGIKEGRTAYNNICKIILFLLSCGLAEVLFFILALVFGYDMPLVAIQLLWLNIVTDGFQDIALSLESTEEGIMREKPRPTNESLFSKDLIIEIIILGLAITVIVFGTWKYLMDKQYDLVLARSYIMMLMVFIQNINVLNCRSERRTVFKESIRDNPILIFTILGSIILQIILSEMPVTAAFLNVTPLSLGAIIKLLIVSFIIIIIFEIYKLIYRKKKGRIQK